MGHLVGETYIDPDYGPYHLIIPTPRALIH